MILIYEPAGRAQEYSPMALNIYSNCDHLCRYCFNKDRFPHVEVATPRKNIIENLAKELTKNTPNQQVLLSFVGDPYCNAEENLGITRQVLELFSEYHVPTAILTKGGERCLRDIDLFKNFKAPLKVGASLTFSFSDDQRLWEPGAASPVNRVETLRTLSNVGIMTWASLEPVIDPAQSLELIEFTHDFIDQYAVGTLNHHPNKTDWTAFGNEAVYMLRDCKKRFYVKEDLRKHITITLRDVECDPNTITLPTRDIYLSAIKDIIN